MVREDNSPVTLYPKKSSAILLLLLSSVFVAGGAWMAHSGEWIGYLCAGFFGLGVPVAVVKMLPGSTFLRIDSEGITFASLFRKESLPWRAFQDFFVVTLRQTGMNVHEAVGFNYVPSYPRAAFGRALSSAIAGCEGALPDTYGKRADELAALLNARLVIARGHE